MVKRSKYILAFATILCFGMVAAYFRFGNEPPADLTAARVAFLVTEMTTTPARQQLALDELVRGSDQAIPFLLPYLHDQRALATSNVKFLNTQSPPVEEYFLTLAKTVDELTLRYICWKTMACYPGLDEKDQADKALQLERLSLDCRVRFPKAEQCPQS